MRRGARVAAPLFPAAAALGASFGVLARTAHFDALAAVSVLGAGGGVAAAVAAALLLNARYTPIGITVAQSFRGHVLKRFAESQLVVDESWALAGGGTARFDRRVLPESVPYSGSAGSVARRSARSRARRSAIRPRSVSMARSQRSS